MREYYSILGVEENASTEDIKKAYRKKAIETHPDKGGNEEDFKKISEAFQVLSDPDKRSNYDRFGTPDMRGGGNPFSGGGFEDIFSQFGDMFGFGGGGRKQRVGLNIKIDLSLTLDEIYSGVHKNIKVIRKIHCDECNGNGGTDIQTCGPCNGSGQMQQHRSTPFGRIIQNYECPNCQGSGKSVKNPCKKCNGGGIVDKEETISVDIPKGVHNDMVMSMQGAGHAIKGGINGDLHIVVEEIPHKVFKRDGDNLICDYHISIPDAVLGREASINTLDGNVKFMVEPGPNRTIKFSKKGMPNISRNDMYGDLYANIIIDVPTQITEEEIKIFNKLKKSQSFK